MKILLADDDSKMHVIIRLWLSRNGHEVETVMNGRAGLAKLEAEEFDGLITDVNMPLMNGVELVQAALALANPPGLIIVLTSRCDIAQLAEEVKARRVHLFNKPFSPAALAELIEELRRERV